jgi:hypothetical protein
MLGWVFLLPHLESFSRSTALGDYPPGLLRFYTLMGTFVPIFTAGAAPKGG